MSALVEAPAPDALDPNGWECCDEGEIAEGGLPQCPAEFDYACFKHSQTLHADDVFKMTIVEGNNVIVGFAGQNYDPKKDMQTVSSVACVELGNATAFVGPNISGDGEEHDHYSLLKDYIPTTKPYDLAMRCDKDGNVPQIQFNDDGMWHDFASDGRLALKPGPWFPFLTLHDDDRLDNLCVHRPRATKSAGKTLKRKAAAPVGDSAGAV